jgi:beta-glucosidase
VTHLAWSLAIWGVTAGFCQVGSLCAQPTLSADDRAEAAERKLTDVERLQLLMGIVPIPAGILPMPSGPVVPDGVKVTAGFIKGVSRLGIPDILETDASLGVTNPLQLRISDVATAMASGLALAASFDTDLAFQGGATIGAEARAKGFNVLLGGGVNLARDPRNGRNFEYLGEDVLLAGTMAGSAIAGTQSQGVISTIKHFALNDQETLRQTLDARIDEAALRESDLLAFELAIERGHPGAVMCAYNKVQGEHACGNKWLLNQVLKTDWNYPGWVMSDWGAVHDASYFPKGLDQESGAQLDSKMFFGTPLRAEIAAGRVPKQRISAAVRRILRSLYAVGADRPSAEAAVDYAAHARVAQREASEGMVLLKNDGVLPLDSSRKNILIVGGHADVGVISGGGSSQVTAAVGPPIIIPMSGSGPLMRAAYMASSPLKALQAAIPHAVVTFDSGYDVESAAAIAAHADLAIVFATQWQMEGFDHASMDLPDGQNELIEAIARHCPRVVVVLETGNPIKMPWLTRVGAVVEAWYPGERGGEAIADVLSGAVNPSGHLPISFPLDESQLPRPIIAGLGLPDGTAVTVDYQEGADVGYRRYAAFGSQPLFSFGFGLSFTQFEFTALKTSTEKTRAQLVHASFIVKNTGERTGVAVPQLYLVSAAGQRLERLVGFARIPLEPQENRVVAVTIDSRLLGSWDGKKHRWTILGGDYFFALGVSASDLNDPVSIRLPMFSLKP